MSDLLYEILLKMPWQIPYNYAMPKLKKKLLKKVHKTNNKQKKPSSKYLFSLKI